MEGSGSAPTCFAVNGKLRHTTLQSADGVEKLNTVGKSARAVLGRKDIGFGVVHGRRRKVRVQVQVQVPLPLPVQAQVQAPRARRTGVRVKGVCKRMGV